jgi:hypothetical protein
MISIRFRNSVAEPRQATGLYCLSVYGGHRHRICPATSVTAPSSVSRYRRNVALSAVMLLSILTSGCDPGHSYSPVDTRGMPMQQWSATVNGVEFDLEGFTKLAGSDRFAFGLQITNNSSKPAVLLDAQLSTNDGGVINATLPGYGDPQFRTVAPGKSKEISLSWNLQRRNSSSGDFVLGAKTTCTCRVRIGTQEHLLQVQMHRD